MSVEQVRFAAFTDLHLDIMHDGVRRLEPFFRAAEEADVDFIIHLGDFCYPCGVLGVSEEARLPVNLQLSLDKPPIQPGREELLERFQNFSRPSYHVLGNHEMDFCSKEDAMAVYGMSASYYSFHCKGWQFVVLDGNHYRDDAGQLRSHGYANSYYRDQPYLGQSQLQWLEAELAASEAPAVLFCHQSAMGGSRDLKDSRELMQMLDRLRSRGKKIRLWMNGHLHIDRLLVRGDMVHFSLNSISNFWAGEEYETLRYPAGIDEDYPSLRYTFPYEKPVFAIVTLTEENMTVQGRPGKFVQPGSRSFRVRPLPTSCVRSRKVAWPGNKKG